MSANQTPNSNQASPSKNNTIWWIIGACILIPVILAILSAILAIAGGYFVSQKIVQETTNNQLDNSFTDELEKLEKELEKLNDDSDQTDPSVDKNSIEESNPSGTIEGSLSYPSEVIPDMTVCAQETSGNFNDICTINLIDDPKYTAGRGYKLVVPPGTYNIYAYLGDSSYKAYYSEFVTCGLDIGCPSHDYIDIVVEDSDHYQNVDPIDWYAP
ncbi:MAG: hypothetical protein WC570_00160 [Patescibacteria group bacterium]